MRLHRVLLLNVESQDINVETEQPVHITQDAQGLTWLWFVPKDMPKPKVKP